MQIQNAISHLFPLANAAASPAGGTAGTNNSSGTNGSSGTNNTSTILSGTDPLANEETFLQLMVAQLKNQDPLQPTDGAQFLGQLAQFSQLEQLMGIHTDLNTLTATQAPAGATGGTNNGTTGTNGTTSN